MQIIVRIHSTASNKTNINSSQLSDTYAPTHTIKMITFRVVWGPLKNPGRPPSGIPRLRGMAGGGHRLSDVWQRHACGMSRRNRRMPAGSVEGSRSMPEGCLGKQRMPVGS